MAALATLPREIRTDEQATAALRALVDAFGSGTVTRFLGAAIESHLDEAAWLHDPRVEAQYRELAARLKAGG